MRFRTKILLCMVWILVLALGISGTMLIWFSFSDALSRERENLLQSYRIASSVMETAMENPKGKAIELVASDTFHQMQSVLEWNYAKLDLNGTELYSKGESIPINHEAPNVGECRITVFHPSGTRHCIYLDAGITVDDSRLTVTLSRDISHIYEARNSMLSAFRKVFLVSLAAGSSFSLILSTALTSPLRKVSRATRQMANGNLTVRLNARSKDEIGQLSADFDYMADKLEDNITAIENAMAAQERFMGSFAHELKTPMTSIIGYADLLRTQSLADKDAQDAANYIFSEGKRLESLSWKLLQLHLAKHEKPDLEAVEMDKFVVQIVRQLRPVYEKSSIHLNCRTQSGLWHIDPELMKSVLTNLMDNSRKAMEHGGMIILTVDFPDGNCRIRIADNGCGMPPEVLKHLTEAFYRVDKSRSRAQGGAGLGLSLCNEIIRYHNGELHFESIPGQGTCVSVILKGA